MVAELISGSISRENRVYGGSVQSISCQYRTRQWKTNAWRKHCRQRRTKSCLSCQYENVVKLIQRCWSCQCVAMFYFTSSILTPLYAQIFRYIFLFVILLPILFILKSFIGPVLKDELTFTKHKSIFYLFSICKQMDSSWQGQHTVICPLTFTPKVWSPVHPK